MTSVLLVDTNITPFNEAFPVYPTGLDYLQGALRERDYAEVHILDLTRTGGPLPGVLGRQRRERSFQILRDALLARPWDIIGLSLRNIDSTYPVGDGDPDLHYYVPELRKMIDLVVRNARRDQTVILGGPAFSMMPEVFLENTPENCHGVLGSGEESLCALADGAKQGNPLDRVVRSPRSTIGKLQNRALLEAYFTRPFGGSTFGIRTRVGCGQQCGYCPYPAINGTGQVFKEPDVVLEEIRLLRSAYDRKRPDQPFSFMFSDDIFNRPLEPAKAILEAMINRKAVPDSWHAYMDPHLLDEEFLELILKTRGWSRGAVVFFPFDIESGSQKMLQKLGKPYGVEDLRRSVEVFKKVTARRKREDEVSSNRFGFHVLLGYPGEDRETVRETCMFIRENQPDRIAFQLGVRIYPRTPLADETKGIVWKNESDLVLPVFAVLDQGEVLGWLEEWLSPDYELVSTKGNMVLFS